MSLLYWFDLLNRNFKSNDIRNLNFTPEIKNTFLYIYLKKL